MGAESAIRSMVSIKGRQDGLLVSLDEVQSWAAHISELETQLKDRQGFFAGARLALEVGGRSLSLEHIQDLQARLAQHDIRLWAVIGSSDSTRVAARHLNLATEISRPRSKATTPETKQLPPAGEEGDKLLYRTLRSGQKIRHPGHITIIGDVNPGAEIIAGGHVIVWGRLQGMVHAGAMGDESAVVCALVLSPTQLRIGGHIARSPEEKRKRKTRPEMASIVGGRIIAEPWDSKKRRKKQDS